MPLYKDFFAYLRVQKNWDEESKCYKYKCSKCGNEQPFDTEFCWTCGTDMRGKR